MGRSISGPKNPQGGDRGIIPDEWRKENIVSVLVIVFVMFSGVFGLIFLFDCIRFGKQIITYVRYGIACGLIFLAIDTAMILLIPNFFTIIPVYKLIALDLWALVRIAVFTCMGMYCCSILGIKDFPVIRCLRNHEESNALCRGNNLLLFAGAVVLLAVQSYSSNLPLHNLRKS